VAATVGAAQQGSPGRGHHQLRVGRADGKADQLDGGPHLPAAAVAGGHEPLPSGVIAIDQAVGDLQGVEVGLPQQR
jgi:hypothetical protein